MRTEEKNPILSFTTNDIPEFSKMFYYMKPYYACPICGYATKIHFISKIIDKPLEVGLMCGHVFNSFHSIVEVSFIKFEPIEEQFLSFETNLKDGTLYQRFLQRCHSFLYCYYNAVCGQMANANSGLNTWKNTAGTSKTGYGVNGTANLNVNGGAGSILYGIVIGTGGGANNPDPLVMYGLTTIIPHATVNYGAEGKSAPSVAGNDITHTCYRNFNNVSAGPVTITEAGAYGNNVTSAPANEYGIFWRDLLGTPVVLAIGANTTATYTLKITVS